MLAAARTVVRLVLDLWDCDDPDDALALLTGEVVTNAVRHGAGVLATHVDLSLLDGVLQVAAEVSTSARPVPRTTPADAVGGRGLLLVEALAARWGSTPTDRGKVVWFEFPVRRPGTGGNSGPGGDGARSRSPDERAAEARSVG